MKIEEYKEVIYKSKSFFGSLYILDKINETLQ